MIKDTASQSIGAQMVDASDGSAFTNTVTVYITGDAGTQSLGSVSAGVCTHEGNGYHTYRPSQAETNYDLIAFTFIGTGAIPQTIQVATVSTTQTTAFAPTSLSSSTGQAILDRMEILHPELQLQTGESDVAKALIAVNMAQSYLEGVLAQVPGILGEAVNTVTTTADTESSTFPIGLLRLDKLQYLDENDRPVWDLDPIYETGAHAPASDWLSTSAAVIGGKPRRYWTNGRSIYWDPIPDDAYSIRWYGFQAASTITAAGTVTYPDICLLPLATMAVKLWRIGLDDDASVLSTLAQEVFQPVVNTLSGFRREGPKPLRYRYGHVT